MKDRKKMKLVQVLNLIKEGSSPAKISKDYNINKSTLSRIVGKLKKLGCIEKVGYGTWRFLKEVSKVPKGSIDAQSKTSQKQIRGHAFIWVIEFLEGGYDWHQIVKNYKKRYIKPKLSFSLICRKTVPRTIFKHRKIWMTKKGLTIYEPLDYLGRSSFSVKGTAVYEMDNLIKDLLKELRQKIQYYKFTCSREHFAHVKNQIARQFNEKKQKLHVEFDGKHFWIDHSDGEHEQETNNPNTSRQAQKYYEEQVETEFAVSPKKIIKKFNNQDKVITKAFEGINGNALNHKKYAKNLQAHVQSVKDLGAGVKKQNEIFEKILELLNNKL